MDYFKLFAYATFLFGIIAVIGTVLYWFDLWLFPDDEDTTPAKHRADA